MAPNRLVTYSEPSHYLNQYWVIISWTLSNKLQWNFSQNSNVSIQENAFENVSAKWRPFRPEEDELKMNVSMYLLDQCAGNRTRGYAHDLFSTLRPRQNGHHFADDIFKCISLNENFWILNKIPLKYVPYGLIDNMAALVQIMAWRRADVKPLSEPMMAYFTDAYMHHPGSMN